MYEPKGPWENVNIHKIPINGSPYEIVSLVSKDNVTGWMPNSEQQHVNPQYRDGVEIHPRLRINPVYLYEFSPTDAARIVAQAISFQTKRTPSIEEVIRDYKGPVEEIFVAFKSFKGISPFR